jgi:hypothetical protein
MRFYVPRESMERFEIQERTGRKGWERGKIGGQ